MGNSTQSSADITCTHTDYAGPLAGPAPPPPPTPNPIALCIAFRCHPACGSAPAACSYIEGGRAGEYYTVAKSHRGRNGRHADTEAGVVRGFTEQWVAEEPGSDKVAEEPGLKRQEQ